MKTMATVEKMHDDLKQKWSRTGERGMLRDQFGNYITGYPGYYTLENGETKIKGLHCLNAAKEIAKILVNDKIV